MLRPSTSIIKDFTTFIFGFLWGTKNDKMKRNIVIQQKREEGGLDMIYPENFLSSMKLKLIQKIGDVNFVHKWKEVILNQVLYPEHPGICFENGLVHSTYSFTYDLIHCYIKWKEKAAKVRDKCINHCVWGNQNIKDIGSKLWLPKLIDNNVNYLSDFVNEEGGVYSYREFCANTLDRCSHIISKREYLDIKMSIRRFNNTSISQKNLQKLDKNICLAFFTDFLEKNSKACKIRDFSHQKIDFIDILPLNNWARDLGLNSIEWNKVFRKMYGSFTKNFKLLQFQYKLLMRISTCRHTRFKMKIDIKSPNCIYCLSTVETLVHIFLECPITITLADYVKQCIIDNLVSDYSDPNKLFYITCSHDNPSINYIWAAFKIYISRSFQLFQEPSLTGFKNSVLKISYGENENIIKDVKLVLGLP